MSVMDLNKGDSLVVDSSLKNKFVWSWLENIDCNNDRFAEYIVKLNVCWVAKCKWCMQHINYGSSGKGVFFKLPPLALPQKKLK